MKKPYGLQADVWGLGVMLYTLLVGRSPFDDGKVRTTLRRVIYQNPEFPPDLSPNAVHLITGVLQKSDEKRFTLKQILSHPFLTGSSLMSGYNHSLSSWSASDSGIGTTTMTTSTGSYSSKSRSSAGKNNFPDIRQPLLAQVPEDSSTTCKSIQQHNNLQQQGPLRPRSATPVQNQHNFRINHNEEYNNYNNQPVRPRSSSLGRKSPTSSSTVQHQKPKPNKSGLSPPLSTVRLRPSKVKQSLKPGIRGKILEDGKVDDVKCSFQRIHVTYLFCFFKGLLRV